MSGRLAAPIVEVASPVEVGPPVDVGHTDGGMRYELQDTGTPDLADVIGGWLTSREDLARCQGGRDALQQNLTRHGFL